MRNSSDFISQGSRLETSVLSHWPRDGQKSANATDRPGMVENWPKDQRQKLEEDDFFDVENEQAIVSHIPLFG